MFEGIPCGHELCVYFKETTTINKLNINQRWTKQFFNPESLPEIIDDNESDENNENNDESSENNNEPNANTDSENAEIFSDFEENIDEGNQSQEDEKSSFLSDSEEELNKVQFNFNFCI